MPQLLLRPEAEADLVQLYQYISERSSDDIAIGYIRRIRMRCEMMLAFPESGRRRDDLRPGIRIVGFERRVAIAFTSLSNGDIEIGRIFYGGRDYEALLRDDQED